MFSLDALCPSSEKQLIFTSLISIFPAFCSFCFKILKSIKMNWKTGTKWITNQYCVKKVRIQSFSSPFFPAVGLNAQRHSISLCILSECGKIRIREFPNTDTFHTVELFLKQSICVIDPDLQGFIKL